MKKNRPVGRFFIFENFLFGFSLVLFFQMFYSVRGKMEKSYDES